MPIDVFPRMTPQQVVQNLIGTPAYQMIHAKDQPKSRIPTSHYATLVQPSMRPPSKSIPKHLGQVPAIMAGKNSQS